MGPGEGKNGIASCCFHGYLCFGSACAGLGRQLSSRLASSLYVPALHLHRGVSEVISPTQARPRIRRPSAQVRSQLSLQRLPPTRRTVERRRRPVFRLSYYL